MGDEGRWFRVLEVIYTTSSTCSLRASAPARDLLQPTPSLYPPNLLCYYTEKAPRHILCKNSVRKIYTSYPEPLAPNPGLEEISQGCCFGRTGATGPRETSLIGCTR